MDSFVDCFCKVLSFPLFMSFKIYNLEQIIFVEIESSNINYLANVNVHRKLIGT